MIVSCWLCEESFPTRKQLRVHVAGQSHGKLRVVCPYCTSERSFARVADLKKHCKEQHAIVEASLPKDFFSEGNGFWLGLYPNDYKKVVCPSEENSEEAVAAKSAISTWLSVNPKSSRSRGQWESGWKTVQDKDSEQIANTPAATPMYQAAFSPQQLQYLHSSITPVDVAYSPSRPDMGEGELKLVKVELGQENYVTLKSNTGQWYRAKLDTAVFGKGQYVTALNRRIIALGANTSEDMPPGEYLELTGTHHHQTRERISTEIGIPAELITDVSARSVVLPKPVSVVKTLPFPFPTYSGAAPQTDACHTMESDSSLSDSLMSVEESLGLRKGRDGVNSECITILAKTVSESPQVTATTSNSECANNKHTEQLPESTVQEMGRRNQKERALWLLSYGAMPLVPPGRRVWDKDQAVKLQGRVNSVVWPPAGWKEMTKARRVVAWQYAAMTLDADEDGFPRMTGPKLLDSYNMLAQPGTDDYVCEGQDKIIQKIRLYNLKFLQDVAKTGQGDESMLSQLELASVHQDNELSKHGCCRYSNQTVEWDS